MDINILRLVYAFTSWWILGLFPVLAIMYNAATDIHIIIFIWTYIFIFLDVYLGVELPGHSKFIFTFLRNGQTVF